jgi:hypothetical protein
MPFNLIERHGSVEKAAGLNGCLATFYGPEETTAKPS